MCLSPKWEEDGEGRKKDDNDLLSQEPGALWAARR